MAPGVLCVWSRADPEGDTRGADAEEDGEVFTDRIAEVHGVSRGYRLERGESQTVDDPSADHTHRVPFLTFYELPDTVTSEEKEFKEAVAGCAFKEDDTFAPRVYEEVECIEAEGFKGVIGDLIAVITGEGFKKDFQEEFFKFHREEFVSAFLEAPEFIRAQVFKMVGDVSPDVSTQIPTGPYMFIYHWDCYDIPWSPVVEAAQTKGYVKYIESGIKWQGLNYHPIRFTEKKSMKEEGDMRSDLARDSEGEEVDGVAAREASDAEEADLDEKNRGSPEDEPEETDVSLKKPGDISNGVVEKEPTASTISPKEKPKEEQASPKENPKEEQPDTVASNGTSKSYNLNGTMQSLSIDDTSEPKSKDRASSNIVAGAEALPPKAFASVSVADKIKAWERNSAT